MTRVWSAIVMVALILTAFASPVSAEDLTKKVEELSGQAAAAYGEGDYEKAIELFKEAYALQPVPNLLFNIAKVYEKSENWDEAENNYKEFIKSPDADSKAREVALERIDAIKEIKAAAKAAEDPPDKVDKPDDKDPPPPPPEESANILPWIVIGSGVVFAGTGGVFGFLASKKQSDFDAATDAQTKADLRKTGKTFALVADIGYGVGLVAGVVGVIMLVTSGGSDEAPASGQALIPTGWVTPNGEAGVGLHWNF